MSAFDPLRTLQLAAAFVTMRPMPVCNIEGMMPRTIIFFGCAMLALAVTSGQASPPDQTVFRGSTNRWTLTFSGSDLEYGYRYRGESETWDADEWKTRTGPEGLTYSGFFTRHFVAAGEAGSIRVPFRLTMRKRACHDRLGKAGSVTARLTFLPADNGFAHYFDDQWGCGKRFPQKAGRKHAGEA
jgi:hypothetical protein